VTTVGKSRYNQLKQTIEELKLMLMIYAFAYIKSEKAFFVQVFERNTKQFAIFYCKPNINYFKKAEYKMGKKKKKPMTRSENMSRIRGKDTSIELILRKALWKKGLRYRKDCKDVFGRPDICFKSKKIAVFCDSEYWHGKYLMEGRYIPKTNTEFWVKKIQSNIERDKKVNQTLEQQNWKVLRFWGEDIIKNTEACIEKIMSAIKTHDNEKVQ
jgi:DNA mismatch endonuclease (patch repair protein)